MIARIAMLGLAGLVLAGCQTTGPASVKGGECRIFERPEYAVRGKRRYDQDWIDSQIEGGVGGCGWKRPSPRPASIEGRPEKAVAKPVRRRSVVERIKERVAPSPAPLPAPVAVQPALAAPVDPVDPVDELLGTSSVRRVY